MVKELLDDGTSNLTCERCVSYNWRAGLTLGTPIWISTGEFDCRNPTWLLQLQFGNRRRMRLLQINVHRWRSNMNAGWHNWVVEGKLDWRKAQLILEDHFPCQFVTFSVENTAWPLKFHFDSERSSWLLSGWLDYWGSNLTFDKTISQLTRMSIAAFR